MHVWQLELLPDLGPATESAFLSAAQARSMAGQTYLRASTGDVQGNAHPRPRQHSGPPQHLCHGTAVTGHPWLLVWDCSHSAAPVLGGLPSCI